MNPVNLPRFLSVKDVASRLRVSVPTVWRWSSERVGFPKPVRLGPGVTRWALAEIEAFEAQIGADQ